MISTNTEFPISSDNILNELPNITIQLLTKHHCILQDFMLLKPVAEVCILLPKLRHSQNPTVLHKKLNTPCKESAIMFDNNCNKKYYFFAA